MEQLEITLLNSLKTGITVGPEKLKKLLLCFDTKATTAILVQILCYSLQSDEIPGESRITTQTPI